AHWRHPEWWVERVRKAFPKDWQSVLKAGNMHPPMSLRPNRGKLALDEYGQMLDQAGISWKRIEPGALLLDAPLAAEKVPGFSEGMVSIQDAGAQYAATLLGARDGERVLDACSAPGGKTAHILESAKLDLLALDADPIRLARV